MYFDKPKTQWDDLDQEDREYMDFIRKLKLMDLNKLHMYLQTEPELLQKVSAFFNQQRYK
jgi:hypothetical protein